MDLILEKTKQLKHIELQNQVKNEIKQFFETKEKVKLHTGIDESLVDKTFVIAVQKHLNEEMKMKTKKR